MQIPLCMLFLEPTSVFVGDTRTSVCVGDACASVFVGDARTSVFAGDARTSVFVVVRSTYNCRLMLGTS